MCSYNKLNGTAACENKELLIDILKEEVSRVLPRLFRTLCLTSSSNSSHFPALS